MRLSYSSGLISSVTVGSSGPIYGAFSLIYRPVGQDTYILSVKIQLLVRIDQYFQSNYLLYIINLRRDQYKS